MLYLPHQSIERLCSLPTCFLPYCTLSTNVPPTFPACCSQPASLALGVGFSIGALLVIHIYAPDQNPNPGLTLTGWAMDCLKLTVHMQVITIRFESCHRVLATRLRNIISLLKFYNMNNEMSSKKRHAEPGPGPGVQPQQPTGANVKRTTLRISGIPIRITKEHLARILEGLAPLRNETTDAKYHRRSNIYSLSLAP